MLITILDELRQWLAGLKQERLADKFIGGGWLGDKLLTLTREDLADLGVPKEQRGDLMLAVEALRQGEGRVTLPDEHAPQFTDRAGHRSMPGAGPASAATVAGCRGRDLARSHRPRVPPPAGIAHGRPHRAGDLSTQGIWSRS